MATTTQPRPGLQAYRESLSLAFPDLVASLANSIGRKLTAYVAGVKDVRALDRWMEGKGPLRGRGTPPAVDVSGCSHIART